MRHLIGTPPWPGTWDHMLAVHAGVQVAQYTQPRDEDVGLYPPTGKRFVVFSAKRRTMDPSSGILTPAGHQAGVPSPAA